MNQTLLLQIAALRLLSIPATHQTLSQKEILRISKVASGELDEATHSIGNKGA